MIVLKGDMIKLKSGEIGTVIDTWGIARNWIKVDTGNGQFVLCVTEYVAEIIKRDQRRKWH